MRRLVPFLLLFGCEQESLHKRPPADFVEPETEPTTTVPADEGTIGKCTFKPQTVHLEAVPTALLLMMDRSNSMKVVKTADGGTRWQAVTQAMQDFLADARSQSLLVGLTFFPFELATDPPSACSKDEDCGLYGPCEHFGGSGACLVSLGTKPYASCDPADYVAMRVPPVKVADEPTKVRNVFSTEEQWGNTPTGPALAGGLQAVEAYAAAHPNAKAALVFVTDGEPTECAPQDKNGLAAIAKAGFDKGHRTYVLGIGVGSAVMNSIALAGSGDATLAFLIDGKTDVAANMLDALTEIRAASRSCDFAIKAEGELDVSKLSLSIETAGKKDALPYVQTADKCSGAGWYYQAASDGSPVAVLCPASCAALQLADDTNVIIGDVCLSE